MTALLEADAARGFGAGLDLVPVALAATRGRLRGPEVDAVLHGAPSVRQPFTWLRPRMVAAEA